MGNFPSPPYFFLEKKEFIMDKMCNVKNRSASLVVYKIPEENIRREFKPGESRPISYDELVKLTFQPGGRDLMEQYLQITEEEVTNSLNIRREPEYDMSEAQVRDLMLNGELAAFLDCLDYAPVGIIDLIKRYAVSLPLNDRAKIEALKDKTGFDTEAALRNQKADKEPEDGPFTDKKEETTTTAAKPSGRRTNVSYKTTDAAKPAPTYKVVEKK